MITIEKCPACKLSSGTKEYPNAFEPVMASESIHLRNPRSIGIEIKCPLCSHSAKVIAQDVLPLPISDSLMLMDALFPRYCGELHLYTFVVVTREEYEQKRRIPCL